MATEEEQMQGPSGSEEKIYVSVRLRPLNDKERLRNDVPDWECINNTTIIYRSHLSISFDRVFGPECCTRQVYDQGAKEVAFSVVSGVNANVFAYGQTSSGKTYTMSGITDCALVDIYDYIDQVCWTLTPLFLSRSGLCCRGHIQEVIMGLTADELENVDAVDGNEYERVTVGVVRDDNSEKMQVKTYIWINKDDPDIGGEWDFEEWKRLHKKSFIESFKEIMEWKKNPQGKVRDDFNHMLKENSGNVPSP